MASKRRNMFYENKKKETTEIVENLTEVGPGLVNSREWLESDIHGWTLMTGPGAPCALTVAYLAFVLWLGPAAMKKRRPYSLQAFAVLYNACMILYSSWMLYELLFAEKGQMLYLLGAACRSPGRISATAIKQFDFVCWYYMLSKYIEFIDTVVFVLRQKHNQVTFLHVYHHTNMALSTWYVIKHLRERHVVFIAIVNSFVHVFMYTYYMLAAMGPNYRKYLWWKPYVTKLQIGQFIIIIGYQLSLVLYGCDINSSSMIFFILNTISFLLLFANFYKKAYITKREQYKQQQLKSK